MEGISADLVTSGWMALGVIAVALIVAGVRNKVVIYYDVADMGISALAIVLPIAAMLLASYQPFFSPMFSWLWKWGLLSIGYASGLYCLLLNFINAMRHNRSVLLGLFVGALKIVFLVLSFVVIYSQTGSRKDRKNTIEEVLFSWTIILCMVFLAKAMVNGPAVYKVKGWRLPQPKRHIWSIA